MALRWNAEMRLRRTPCGPSNVLPCHANRFTSFAISTLYVVPGAMIAVPSAGPSGIGPDWLALNRSSSSVCVIFSKSGTVMVVVIRTSVLHRHFALKDYIRRFLRNHVDRAHDEESRNAREHRRVD